MAITIAILSQKGGTGKTTLTRSLADGLTRAGLKTLAIDSDPQGNLSEYFGVPAEAFPTLGEDAARRPVPGGFDVIGKGAAPAADQPAPAGDSHEVTVRLLGVDTPKRH